MPQKFLKTKQEKKQYVACITFGTHCCMYLMPSVYCMKKQQDFYLRFLQALNGKPPFVIIFYKDYKTLDLIGKKLSQIVTLFCCLT